MASTEMIRTIVGIAGNVISCGLFLSPVPTFVTIWKKKDVEQFSAIPYIATLLNCLLWVLYGLPIVHPDSTLVLTVNGLGVVIELCYIVLFVTYADSRKKLRVILVVVAEIGSVVVFGILVIVFLHTTSRRSTVVGILCVIFCIIMYVAPLSVMKMVIKTKSVEYMPLYLSLAAFGNGTCWTVYSLLKFDVNILVPNGVGLLFAIAQLILYAMYYKSTQRILEGRKKGEIDLTNVVVVRGDESKVGNAH